MGVSYLLHNVAPVVVDWTLAAAVGSKRTALVEAVVIGAVVIDDVATPLIRPWESPRGRGSEEVAELL